MNSIQNHNLKFLSMPNGPLGPNGGFNALSQGNPLKPIISEISSSWFNILTFFGPDEYILKMNEFLDYFKSDYIKNLNAYCESHDFNNDKFSNIEISITDDHQIKLSCCDKFVSIPIEAIEPWALNLQDQCDPELIDIGGDIIEHIDEIIMEEW